MKIYRRDIDGLRAIAIITVVIYHADILGSSGGFVGVDVFFVISGYLITSIVASEIAEDRFSLLSFYERRARRLLPALTVVIFTSFGIGWFVLLPAELERLGGSAIAAALFLSNIYFQRSVNYFSPAAEYEPLIHTWSLSIEEQFYLLFPIILLVLMRKRREVSVRAVFAFVLLSFAAAVIVLPLDPKSVFYQTVFRAWELGTGAVLALASPCPPRRRIHREVAACVGLAAILAPVFLYDETTPFPASTALPPVLGAAILLWIGGVGGGSVVTSLLSWRPLVWIGVISYSLYLWHWPIFAYVRIVLATATLPPLIGSLAAAASLLVAIVSYRVVERPFRVVGPSRSRRAATLTAAAVTLTAVAGIGWILYVTEGMPERVPARALVVSSVAEDRNPRRAACFNRPPIFGLCPIGAPRPEGKPVDLLFWGDSHADALMPGLDRAAVLNDRNGVFAGKSACPRYSASGECHTIAAAPRSTTR